MKEKEVNLECPHCGETLSAFEMPNELAWGQVQWACFNNECSYFREGWAWMWENYNVKMSYRYRITNAETGTASPLQVWSETAICDRIIVKKED